MYVYDRANAGLKDKNGVVLDGNTFDLSVGVLQGITLTPYLVYYFDGLCSEVIHD